MQKVLHFYFPDCCEAIDVPLDSVDYIAELCEKLQVEGGPSALELALSTGGLLRQQRYGDAHTPAQYVLAR